MFYCKPRNSDFVLQLWGKNQEGKPAMVLHARWCHYDVASTGFKDNWALIVRVIVSAWVGDPGRCKTETAYHPGGHTKLPKLPVPSQCLICETFLSHFFSKAVRQNLGRNDWVQSYIAYCYFYIPVHCPTPMCKWWPTRQRGKNCDVPLGRNVTMTTHQVGM